MSNIERGARSHQDILDAAWDLIAARGADVSLAEIAKSVGMTRQSIYVHFGSRGGLLIALVRRTDARERIFERFDAALASEDPATRLDACLKVWLDFVVVIRPVASDLIRLRAKDAEAAAAWDDRMADAVELFRKLVRSLQKDGALASPWTVPRATDYLWAACSVQAWTLLVQDRGWSPETASRTLRQVLAKVLLR